MREIFVFCAGMMIIGEVLVDDAIAQTRFSCDLRKCRGACCTLEGARGAPLLDREKELVERVLPVVRKYLSPQSLSVIERKGAVEGYAGNFSTACIGDRDCVFVMYEGDVAKCSIEHAFNRGETGWRKPVSCHLFPLRYSGTAPGFLRYEEIPECAAGREKGKAEGTPLREFVREAMVRRFGGEWVAGLDEQCRAPSGAVGGAARPAEGARIQGAAAGALHGAAGRPAPGTGEG